MNKLPLILTFVGSEDCNTGHILALEHQVDGYLEDIKLAVTEANHFTNYIIHSITPFKKEKL